MVQLFAGLELSVRRDAIQNSGTLSGRATRVSSIGRRYLGRCRNGSHGWDRVHQAGSALDSEEEEERRRMYEWDEDINFV